MADLEEVFRNLAPGTCVMWKFPPELEEFVWATFPHDMIRTEDGFIIVEFTVSADDDDSDDSVSA